MLVKPAIAHWGAVKLLNPGKPLAAHGTLAADC